MLLCENPATMCAPCRTHYRNLKKTISEDDLIIPRGIYPVRFVGRFHAVLDGSHVDQIVTALEQRLSAYFDDLVRVHGFLKPADADAEGEEAELVQVFVLVDFPEVVEVNRQLLGAIFRYFPGGTEGWAVDQLVTERDWSLFRLRFFNTMVCSESGGGLVG
ncbi:hypothetical protein BJX61DRAFT_545361 [Aspergillus egyptiacus]|nr:hypothetical protein BJX61DRAFT_545361 [Aspergillus egyptiacus]